MVGLELVPVPPRREGAFHLAEREALALGGGGADARGARAASGERRANLAGAEEGDEEGHGSCAAARARRPSMAAGATEGKRGFSVAGLGDRVPRWMAFRSVGHFFSPTLLDWAWALFDKGPMLVG